MAPPHYEGPQKVTGLRVGIYSIIWVGPQPLESLLQLKASIFPGDQFLPHFSPRIYGGEAAISPREKRVHLSPGDPVGEIFFSTTAIL